MPVNSTTCSSQLNGFFGIVEQMRAVDTSRRGAAVHPAVGGARMQPCACATTWSPKADEREANQRSAPAVEAGLYLVPRVIE